MYQQAKKEDPWIIPHLAGHARVLGFIQHFFGMSELWVKVTLSSTNVNSNSPYYYLTNGLLKLDIPITSFFGHWWPKSVHNTLLQATYVSVSWLCAFCSAELPDP